MAQIQVFRFCTVQQSIYILLCSLVEGQQHFTETYFHLQGESELCGDAVILYGLKDVVIRIHIHLYS
jgi:hypothetical protein